VHPTYSIEFMSRRGSSIDYTAHMYSIQEHTSMRRRKAQQDGTWRAGRRRLIGLALPSGPRGVGRGRADDSPAACRCALASKPRAARAWGARRVARWRAGGRRWRRAVSAAVGGPVSAAVGGPVSAARRCGGSCGHGCGAPRCPRRQPGCQPPGVAQRRAGIKQPSSHCC
jgi:hypothetical protein